MEKKESRKSQDIKNQTLETKNLFLALRAPKLKPIKPDKGIQGVRILN